MKTIGLFVYKKEMFNFVWVFYAFYSSLEV